MLEHASERAAGAVESEAEVRRAVVEVVRRIFGRGADDIGPYSSLIDDLGAESIDFVELQFELEERFTFESEMESYWTDVRQVDAASLSATGELPAQVVATLKSRQPEFDWSRFGDSLRLTDLPRLITPASIAMQILERMAAGKAGTT